MTEEQRRTERPERKRQTKSVPLTPEQAQVAKELAETLNETLPTPLHQIDMIVHVCGIDFAKEVLRETHKVEAAGGMMTHNGNRRRTIGGVFFYIARGRMTEEQRQEVFPSYNEKLARTQAGLPPFIWEQRMDVINAIRKKGVVQDVRIKLIGRPGEWHKRQDIVIMVMEHAAPYPSLPAGLPKLPPTPTRYTVYIGYKQWMKIERDLRGKKMLLEVEGICVYDEELPGIAVYTTSIKTRKAKGGDDAAAPSNGQHADGAREAGAESAPRAAQKKSEAPTTFEPVPIVIPPNAPPPVQQKLQELYTALNLFRQRVAALEAKPENQRTGLDMARKQLSSTEQQINTILQRYSG